ncbi:MAG: hypothetical protein EOQ50_10120 [Mesorhizobium sp.]|nr:MAG: hypothetical protein EOQ50_10120 [Mesorhizobium sp.]
MGALDRDRFTCVSYSTAPPSVLPDISPTRGEIGSFGFAPSSLSLTGIPQPAAYIVGTILPAKRNLPCPNSSN